MTTRSASRKRKVPENKASGKKPNAIFNHDDEETTTIERKKKKNKPVDSSHDSHVQVTVTQDILDYESESSNDDDYEESKNDPESDDDKPLATRLRRYRRKQKQKAFFHAAESELKRKIPPGKQRWPMLIKWLIDAKRKDVLQDLDELPVDSRVWMGRPCGLRLKGPTIFKSHYNPTKSDLPVAIVKRVEEQISRSNLGISGISSLLETIVEEKKESKSVMVTRSGMKAKKTVTSESDAKIEPFLFATLPTCLLAIVRDYLIATAWSSERLVDQLKNHSCENEVFLTMHMDPIKEHFSPDIQACDAVFYEIVMTQPCGSCIQAVVEGHAVAGTTEEYNWMSRDTRPIEKRKSWQCRECWREYDYQQCSLNPAHWTTMIPGKLRSFCSICRR